MSDLHPVTAAVHTRLPKDFEGATIIRFGEVVREGDDYAESRRVYGTGYAYAGDLAHVGLQAAAAWLEDAGLASVSPGMLRELAADITADAAGRDDPGDDETTD